MNLQQRQLLERVADLGGVATEDLLGTNKKAKPARYRAIFTYLAHKTLGLRLNELDRLLGRNNGAARYMVRRIAHSEVGEPALWEEVRGLLREQNPKTQEG